MKKLFNAVKKFIVVISIIIFVVGCGHWICGYGYIIKGVCFSYFRGHSGPGIDEAHLFYNDTISTIDPKTWDIKKKSFEKSLSKDAIEKLEKLKTVCFLVVEKEKIIYEKYWNGFDAQQPTNTFSAVKSIISLLIGIAIDEGNISSIDQHVSDFLPEYKKGDKAKITIRHLLTMSSGLNWSESRKNPYSDNARAYYG